tara:strand:- start:321 stop:458 length:138 start_codon:yes stop_codon:yes gene_type:complete
VKEKVRRSDDGRDRGKTGDGKDIFNDSIMKEARWSIEKERERKES